MKKILEDYENNAREIHWIFEELSHYWWSNKTKSYYLRIQENELDVQKVVFGLRKELLAFDNALIQYAKFGDIVECDPENKDYILRRYDNLIGHMENTMNHYSHLTVPATHLQWNLGEQKKGLKSEVEKLVTIKSKTKLQVEKIELIENQLRNSWKDIFQVKTEENSTFENVTEGDFSSKYAFDAEQVKLASNKLEPRLLEEEKLIQKLSFYMEELPQFYNTPNSKTIVEINNTFLLSFRRIAESNAYFKRYLDENNREYRDLVAKNIHNLEEL